MKQLTHSIELTASPAEVYKALITSDKHTAFTGAPAEFESKVNGVFSTFNGAITGKITNLVENKRIEMDWRAGGFPEGFYTKVVFDLEKNNKGTTLSFVHSGLPAEAVDMINEGWQVNYWQKLPGYFS